MPIEIGMLLFPDLTQLDLTGPFEMLHRVPDASVHLLWKDTRPVRATSGLTLFPTTALADSPPLDVLFVPGGFGQAPLAKDERGAVFLRAQGARARYVTSVCTGALLLGAAGLLDGYEATTHWAYVDRLQSFGARYRKGRVVVDRNRITGGGVTAGHRLRPAPGRRARRRDGRALDPARARVRPRPALRLRPPRQRRSGDGGGHPPAAGRARSAAAQRAPR